MKRKLAALVATLTMLVGVTAAVNVAPATAADYDALVRVPMYPGTSIPAACTFNVSYYQTLDNRPYAKVATGIWTPYSITCVDGGGTPVQPNDYLATFEVATSFNQWPYFVTNQYPCCGYAISTTSLDVYGPYGAAHTGACVRWYSVVGRWSDWVCIDDYT